MAINTISGFLKGFGGGTRVNRYLVSTSGCGLLAAADTKFHIRAATIPSATVTPIGINWFGRTINIPGERTYEPWTITVLDDVGDKSLYNKFKSWHASVCNYDETIKIDTSKISGCQWTIDHLNNADENSNKTFTLKTCWPVTIGPLVLDMAQDNVLASFEVRILFTHFDYVHKP
jgi:hypothetical protein